MKGSRPLSVYKQTVHQPWRPAGWDKSKRWTWICNLCRCGTGYAWATLPESYADALDHLEDEHLAVI